MDVLAVLSDPAAAGIVVGSLALVLFTAAWHKFAEPHSFLAALAAYRLLPGPLLGPAARALPAAEALLGVALLVPATRIAALAGAAVLFLVYGGAIAANLLRGRSYIDCGCGGAGHPLSWGLVVRNGILAALALGASGPTAERPFGWLDAVTLVLGVLAFYATYLMADELLRQASRMARSEHDARQQRSSLS